MKLEQAFGKKFDKNAVRVKTFEYNNHTFKVKIPLTSEYETIIEAANTPNDELLEKYYAEIVKPFIENREKLEKDGVEFTDNDVIVDQKSMREAAKNKTLIEQRILAMIKLLVPEEKDFDMNTVTYEMVEELFPFSVQLELIDLIANTITPSYKDQKGK